MNEASSSVAFELTDGQRHYNPYDLRQHVFYVLIMRMHRKQSTFRRMHA